LRARLEERIAVAKAAAEQIQAIAGERATLQADLDLVAALERAFSPDGVPALIVENSAIPYLEVEAQKRLGQLGGKTAGARIELRTQRALKSTEGLADALDIVLVTEQGHEREYHNWSGGEQMRIDIVLRYALAKLLYTRGGESGLFVIDEPEGLDAGGKAALVEMLREMQAEGVARVYLISHDSDLRDSFDQTITVMEGDTGSYVVEAGVFEAVPA
jgi:DNA repair exonuclease SbcCD ATPase subunit